MALKNIRLEGPVYTPRDASWQAASSAQRKQYWRLLGDYAMSVKKDEMRRGIGVDGDDFLPVKPESRPDGATGKPLDPHYGESRVIRLLASRVSENAVTLFWHAGISKKQKLPWSTILGYHADGLVRGAPIRDTIGFSPRGKRKVADHGRYIWGKQQRAKLEPPKPPRKLKPEPTIKPPKPPRQTTAKKIQRVVYVKVPRIDTKRIQVYERPEGPPKRTLPKPPGPKQPPKPKPPTPVKPVFPGATPEIRAAAEAQYNANLAAAKATPVVKIPVKTQAVRDAERSLEDTRKLIAKIEAEIAQHRAEWEQIQKQWEKASNKAGDWSVTAETRARWQKQIDALYPRYSQLRNLVPGNEAQLKDWHQYLSEAESKLAAAKAMPEASADYRYADLQTKFPNLIPRGPIKERIEQYKVGDAKVAALVELDKRHRAEMEALTAARAKENEGMGNLIREQAELIHPYAEQNIPIPDHIMARSDAIQARIDAMHKANQAVVEQQRALGEAMKAEAFKLLAVPKGTGAKFTHEDLPPGYAATDKQKLKPLGPLAEPTKKAVDQAQEWLGNMVAKSEVEGVHARIGEHVDVRAHWHNYYDHMQVEHDEKPSVVVHEYGHGIDYRITTGGESAVKRSLEFVAHRVGDEVAVDMHQKFGAGDPGEMGRKDKFTSVFGEYSAHYVGRDYGRDATEGISMGLQLLHEDPTRFARNDPEYLKFILGIADGALR